MSMQKSSILIIHLQPNSKRDEIYGWMSNGLLKIRIRQKPIEGRANRYLINFLSKKLCKRKDEIEIISGYKSRQKRIKFWGIDEEELKLKIKQLID